jgi:iron complex transport system ATP-binding protein
VSALVAEGVTLELGGRRILDCVHLTFRPGEVTALLGPNGAGKSSLLSCLAGLRRPDSGGVRLGDQALAALPHRDRARRIGYLPQTPEIAWAVEVETLVGLGRTPHHGARGLSDEDRQSVTRALEATRMTELAHRDVTTLSGGERGRALIARVLAGEPQWLLADEPLSGLDPGHQLDALALLRGFADGSDRGVILTLHDLMLAARVADRLIVLAEGRVLADGPAREALTPQVLAKAYGVEARWIEGSAGPVLDLVRRLDR